MRAPSLDEMQHKGDRIKLMQATKLGPQTRTKKVMFICHVDGDSQSVADRMLLVLKHSMLSAVHKLKQLACNWTT